MEVPRVTMFQIYLLVVLVGKIKTLSKVQPFAPLILREACGVPEVCMTRELQ